MKEPPNPSFGAAVGRPSGREETHQPVQPQLLTRWLSPETRAPPRVVSVTGAPQPQVELSSVSPPAAGTGAAVGHLVTTVFTASFTEQRFPRHS